MPKADKLVVVDTNCLIRLYFSPLRPLLACPVQGYELKTLAELSAELKGLACGDRHPWLSDAEIQGEVDAAVIVLSRTQKRNIERHAPSVQRGGNAMLHKHCSDQNLEYTRRLSATDARALTAAMELDAALATDEWPLRMVAGKYQADDAGNPVELLCSVELLHLMELEGLLTREERVKTYADWVRFGESLMTDSARIYKRLFGETAPSAQTR